MRFARKHIARLWCREAELNVTTSPRLSAGSELPDWPTSKRPRADRQLIDPLAWRPSRQLALVPGLAGLVASLLLLGLPLMSSNVARAGEIAALSVQETRPLDAAIRPGETETILVTVTNGGVIARNVAVWLAISDAGDRVRWEDWEYPLTFQPGETRRVTFRWLLPRSESDGELTVTARVLHSSWSFDVGHSREPAILHVVNDGS